MHAWEAIQKTLDVIELRINEEISIEELSDIAALSPFYFQRLFSRLVQKPVREYIKLRRLARSCDSLANKENRILDVATDYGFGSHGTFTRAFKETYGITPEQYRNNPVGLNNYDKPDLLLHYVMVDEGVPLISNGLVLEIHRKSLEKPIIYTGVKGHVSIGQQIPVGKATGVDVPGEIWGRFHREKCKLRLKADGCSIGASYMGDAPEGCFTYFAGAETEKETLPDDTGEWQIWTFPACNYIVCGFEAEDFEALVTTALNKAQGFLDKWLKKHGLTHGAYQAEMYFSHQPEGSYMEIWAPVLDA